MENTCQLERANALISSTRSAGRGQGIGFTGTWQPANSRHSRLPVTVGNGWNFPNCQQPGGISHASAAMFRETILFIGCSGGIGSVVMNARMVSKLPRNGHGTGSLKRQSCLRTDVAERTVPGAVARLTDLEASRITRGCLRGVCAGQVGCPSTSFSIRRVPRSIPFRSSTE